MKLISNSHRDGHAALLQKITESLAVHETLLERAETALKATEKSIAEERARPWYKRIFDIVIHNSDYDSCIIHFRKSDIAFLQKLQHRAAYELTIELDDEESNILFCEFKT